ncbi:histidinol-phosphate transaminase [Halomarina oriensis]|uniref:Histidinol-phosphate aminotransferase n=1 Tax=Halomarina oriensis TaxID=671145 RepID=A0A6B0GPK5_9EURY|nr:histidinol-phosphate transaminase [Halomarina oriensis]MWG34025.1 histidinol-phosphate transaminase [Halomarina oriensis]
MEPRDRSSYAVYQAGRGIEEVARELGRDPEEFVVLSSNENPHGPSPAAVETIEAHAGGVNRYPKSSHVDLVEAIAERWRLAPEQVWLAPGGDGALDYLHRAMLDPGDGILVPRPGFAYYAMSARYHHGDVSTYDLSKADDFAQTADGVLASYDGERIVFVISPHSPVGSEMPMAEVERLAAETDDDTLVVVDEAYGEFSDRESKRRLLDERADVAVLRTFSKAYGLAGLRLGYLLTPAAWADTYARVNTPFSVNELACRAGVAALADDEFVEEVVETSRWAREYLHEHLDAPTWESGGNFVLVDVSDAPTDGEETPGSAVAGATQRRGVIVRDCSSFGLPECIRVTTGTREETRRAVDVLNGVLTEVPEA